MGKSTPLHYLAHESKGKSRVPACDACRHRKVRCPRDSADIACARCGDKNIHCVTSAPGKGMKSRTGKRIEEARTLFGPDTDFLDSSFPENIMNGQDQFFFPPDTSSSSDTQSSIAQDFPTSSSDFSLWLSSRSSPDFGLDGFLSQLRNNENNPATMSICKQTISPTDASSRLTASELISSLGAHLINKFFQSDHYMVPAIKDTNFLSDLKAVDGRIENFQNPLAKVLSDVIIAISARGSNHPLLLGSTAPSSEDFAQLYGFDMSQWGNRRQLVCRKLVENALRTSDYTGALRKPHEYSMIACAMMDELLNYSDTTEFQVLDDDPQTLTLGNGVSDRGRAYASGAINHMRLLVEERGYEGDPYLPQSNRQLSAKLVQSLIVRDVGVAVAIGRYTQVNAYDFELFWRDIRSTTLPNVSVLRSALETGLTDDYVQSLRYLLYSNGCVISWLTVSKLNGPIARRKEKLDLDILAKAIKDGQRLLSTATDMLELLRNDESPIAHELDKFVRMILMGEYHRVALFHHIICDRLPSAGEETYWPSTHQLNEINETGFVIEDEGPELSYRRRLQSLKDDSNSRVLSTAVKVVKMMEEVLLSAAPEDVAHCVGLLHIDLRLWTEALLATPPAESGGPAKFPKELKRACLESLLASCYRMGWSWPEVVYVKMALERAGVRAKRSITLYDAMPSSMSHVTIYPPEDNDSSSPKIPLSFRSNPSKDEMASYQASQHPELLVGMESEEDFSKFVSEIISGGSDFNAPDILKQNFF